MNHTTTEGIYKAKLAIPTTSARPVPSGPTRGSCWCATRETVLDGSMTCAEICRQAHIVKLSVVWKPTDKRSRGRHPRPESVPPPYADSKKLRRLGQLFVLTVPHRIVDTLEETNTWASRCRIQNRRHHLERQLHQTGVFIKFFVRREKRTKRALRSLKMTSR